jgi:hypothetical protein
MISEFISLMCVGFLDFVKGKIQFSVVAHTYKPKTKEAHE